jgi:hypothetical protein
VPCLSLSLISVPFKIYIYLIICSFPLRSEMLRLHSSWNASQLIVMFSRHSLLCISLPCEAVGLPSEVKVWLTESQYFAHTYSVHIQIVFSFITYNISKIIKTNRLFKYFINNGHLTSTWFHSSKSFNFGVFTENSAAIFILTGINYIKMKIIFKSKAVPLHAMKALGGRGIAPTHSRPRH